MYKPLHEATLICQVCQEHHHQLLAIADCPHRFCKNCSLSYIQEKSSSFEIPRCLMEGCDTEINESLPLFKFLDATILRKLERITIMKFLRDNPDHAACRTPNCLGTFLVLQGRCPKCDGLHCKKCLNLQHTGACTDQQENIKGLNFRKCPSCRVWVEKSFGCRFINCKCGTEFCYSCGSPFATDPCRKRGIWQRELKIKQLMNDIRIEKPTTFKDWLLLIPRIGAGLLLLSLVAIMVPLTIGLILAMGVLAALFTPLGLFTQINKGGQRNKGCLWKCIGLTIVYPLLSMLIMAGWIIMMVIYPCAHRSNHHGVYDLFDLGLVYVTLGYLKLAHFLLGRS